MHESTGYKFYKVELCPLIFLTTKTTKPSFQVSLQQAAITKQNLHLETSLYIFKLYGNVTKLMPDTD